MSMDAKTLLEKFRACRATNDVSEAEWQIILSALSLAAAVEGPEPTHRLVPIDKTEGSSDAV